MSIYKDRPVITLIELNMAKQYFFTPLRDGHRIWPTQEDLLPAVFHARLETRRSLGKEENRVGLMEELLGHFDSIERALMHWRQSPAEAQRRTLLLVNHIETLDYLAGKDVTDWISWMRYEDTSCRGSISAGVKSRNGRMRKILFQPEEQVPNSWFFASDPDRRPKNLDLVGGRWERLDSLLAVLEETLDEPLEDRQRISDQIAAQLEQSLQENSPKVPRGGSRLNRLTPRQFEVLELIAEGLQDKEIAEGLIISYDTVKNHVTNIFEALGMSPRRRISLAVLYARHKRDGLL